MKRLMSVLVIVATAAISGAAMAGVSAGAFRAENPQDQSSIFGGSTYIANDDPAISHAVVAGLGVVGGLSSYGFTVYGTYNGLAGSTCTLYGYMANGNTSPVYFSTVSIPAGTAGTNFAVPISLTISNSGIFGLNLHCNLINKSPSGFTFQIRAVN